MQMASPWRYNYAFLSRWLYKARYLHHGPYHYGRNDVSIASENTVEQKTTRASLPIAAGVGDGQSDLALNQWEETGYYFAG